MSSQPGARFSPEAMLSNISDMKNMIQRIRHKEGGVGTDKDETTLHRAISDIGLLVDIVDILKDRLQAQSKETSAGDPTV